MKKYFTRRIPFLLLSVILLLLSGYLAIQPAIPSLDDIYIGPYTWHNPMPDQIRTCEDIREYKTGLRQLKADRELITYDSLSRLGKLAGFHYTSAWEYGVYGEYQYYFQDAEALWRECLWVRAKPYESESQESYQKIQAENLTDMRFCNTDEPSQIVLDGICYQYEEGKLNTIAWENETHEFVLGVGNRLYSLAPEDNTFLGKLFNGETAREAVDQLDRSIRLGLVVRRTREVRLIAQWTAAAACLVWGILQLLNISVELRKKYRRGCGSIKLSLAAVFTCMAFVELFEPVYMIVFAAVYVFLLLLVLAQQWLITREYLRMNSDREEYSAVMEARRKLKRLGIATARRLPILILAVTLLLLSVYLVNLAAVPLPDKADYTYGIYSRQVLNAYDLQEYKTAIRQIRQDDSFISYESLRRLGVLRKFVYESDWTKGEYGLYTYSFVDDADPVWRSCTLRICLKAYAEAKKNTADKMLKEYLEDMAFDAERDAFGNKTERLAWETDTHYFLLEYNPKGKSGDDAAVKAELEKLSRSIKGGLAVRKTGSIRLTVQWAVAVVCLVWGILQLLNIPTELRKKTVAQLKDDELRKKYRRDCGIIKLSLAAVFTCMAFMQLFEPVYMLVFAAVYVFLLLLILAQQWLITREYVPRSRLQKEEAA